jgi:hypothetical protein
MIRRSPCSSPPRRGPTSKSTISPSGWWTKQTRPHADPARPRLSIGRLFRTDTRSSARRTHVLHIRDHCRVTSNNVHASWFWPAAHVPSAALEGPSPAVADRDVRQRDWRRCPRLAGKAGGVGVREMRDPSRLLDQRPPGPRLNRLGRVNSWGRSMPTASTSHRPTDAARHHGVVLIDRRRRPDRLRHEPCCRYRPRFHAPRLPTPRTPPAPNSHATRPTRQSPHRSPCATTGFRPARSHSCCSVMILTVTSSTTASAVTIIPPLTNP